MHVRHHSPATVLRESSPDQVHEFHLIVGRQPLDRFDDFIESQLSNHERLLAARHKYRSPSSRHKCTEVYARVNRLEPDAACDRRTSLWIAGL